MIVFFCLDVTCIICRKWQMVSKKIIVRSISTNMSKTTNIFLLIIFASSIFAISNHFVNPPAPTLYIAVEGCYIFAFMVIAQRYKQQTLCLSVSEVLLGGFILLSSIYGAYSGSLNLEWVISVVSLGLLYMLVKRIQVIIKWLFIGLVFIGIAQAIYGLGQYVHWFNNIASSSFRMSGSFDNPAGFAAVLSVCFPFALFLLRKKEICWKILGSLAAVLIIVAVVLSQSRAGVVAIIVISGIWVVKALHPKWLSNWSSRTKIVGNVLLIISLLVGLYFIKKDSANGRLLIWQCSVQMIDDKPLFGHGIGGFQREYMLYQAEYFRSHPDSSYAMLADIVKHPFNEYLLVLVEHGLVGGLLVGFFVFYLIREYCKNKNPERFYAMLCLIGVCVFACFSYPLGYPFVRLMAVFCAAFIMQNESKRWKIPTRLFLIIKPATLVVSVDLLVLTCNMFYDEYHWNVVAQRSLAGETKAVMPDYTNLYKTMNRNGLFLYNYASELNFIDRNKQSNRLFIEASHFMNDIDLQLQMADNYQKIKQYKDAEQCLLEAHYMIPNRFIPLYRLANLYEETGKHHKACNMAQAILNKPIKVASIDVFMIKEEMNQLLAK